MPPLSMHVALARELAPKLAEPVLEAEPGAYYVGATAPDIRVLTRWERERTHFFNLNDLKEQSGVAGIFDEHPELARRADLSESTVAFLAGYVSHLEMDETWILDVYRPCFGKQSPLKGSLLANLLDRVLQYELDRREREDAVAVSEMRNDLLASAVDVTVRFLDEKSLMRWRDVTAEVLTHPTNWDRFSMIAGRHLKAYGVETEADLAHFMRNIPDLLDQAIAQVTPERIRAFQERSRERALAAMRNYLS